MKTLIEEYIGFIVEVIYMFIFIKGFISIMQYLIIKWSVLYQKGLFTRKEKRFNAFGY